MVRSGKPLVRVDSKLVGARAWVLMSATAHLANAGLLVALAGAIGLWLIRVVLDADMFSLGGFMIYVVGNAVALSVGIQLKHRLRG